MADDDFRSYRSRDPLPRDEAGQFANDESDPLAELARLIGQSDPNAAGRRAQSHTSPRSDNDEAPSGVDWAADEDYAQEQEQDRADDRYAPPPSAPPPATSYVPRERVYDDEPAQGGRYFSGPAAQFNGFREEPPAGYREEQMPVLRARDLPAYATAEPGESYEAEEPELEGSEAYGTDEYYDRAPRPRRRGGLIVIMAVLGLAVVGTAGAFGYRAMFGGSVLPTLPPIIKAGNGPIRIVPNYGESQASNSNQAGAAGAASSENLVSREEQPVNIEPAKPAPRVVSTIPMNSGQTLSPPTAAAAAPSGAFATAPNAAPAASPWPPPPPMTTTLPAPASAAGQAQAPTEPKRIHTVTIRPDQAAPAEAASPPASSQPVPRNAARPVPPAPKPAAATSPPPSGAKPPLSNGPGSPVETGAQGPARSRAAAAPVSVASAGPVTGVAAAPAPASTGGYAVQVTSQRSEAEAQASFRELRAKFPNQLNGREPIIRRADLRAKGTYYRALVGPFASMEEAAGMCSGLKAAGGNCIVQKN